MYNKEIEEEERFLKHKFTGVRYYDHPDGEDLLGKLSFTFKWTTVIGIFGGILNTNRAKPLTLKGKSVKILQILLPCVGAGYAFTCVTFYATRLRKKDDQINYALGGAAAGAVIGACCGTLPRAAAGAFYLSIAAVLQKHAQLQGWQVFPSVQQKKFSPYFQRTLASSTIPADKFAPTWTK